MSTLFHHGDFDIKVSGNVLCATISGSWNSQTAKEFSKQFMQQACPFQGNSFTNQVEAENWLAASGFHLDAAYP